MNFAGYDLRACVAFSAKFLRMSQVEGLQVSAVEIPCERIDGKQAFFPGGPERSVCV
jgi:hypothetical protein